MYHPVGNSADEIVLTVYSVIHHTRHLKKKTKNTLKNEVKMKYCCFFFQINNLSRQFKTWIEEGLFSFYHTVNGWVIYVLIVLQPDDNGVHLPPPTWCNLGGNFLFIVILHSNVGIFLLMCLIKRILAHWLWLSAPALQVLQVPATLGCEGPWFSMGPLFLKIKALNEILQDILDKSVC